MRFNGTARLVLPLICLLMQWGLVAVGGLVVIFFLCLGCELPLLNSNIGGLCQEPNFFYRFTGAVGSIPGEFHNIFGGFNMTMADLMDPLLLPQLIERHKPAIFILGLTAIVACVSRCLTGGTPIFMMVPQPPLATPRACTVLVMGGG